VAELRLCARPWSGVLSHAAGSQQLEMTHAAADAAFLEAPTDAQGAAVMKIDGKAGVAAPVAHLGGIQNLGLFLAPYPLDPTRGLRLTGPDGLDRRLIWLDAPRRAPDGADEGDPAHRPGLRLMTVLRRMAARLEAIEADARAAPAMVWETTLDRWRNVDEDHNPTMDVIVRQARELAQTLAHLGDHPRKVLRRTHRMTPVAQAQEMDRRSLMWVLRQPGATVIEKAGPAQQVMAPARFETPDTPENRALRSYLETAAAAAREYRRLNRSPSQRRAVVEAFGRRCASHALRLKDDEVGAAGLSVQPNYVLLHDARYRAIWEAWRELLDRRRAEDELWRWQAAAWAEFVAVALAVACAGLPGARLVALSPLRLAPEMARGRRLMLRQPLAVFYLAQEDRVVELKQGVKGATASTAPLGAALWMRSADPAGAFGRWVPVWALHGLRSAPLRADIDGMMQALNGRPSKELIAGGVALRMALEVDAPFETNEDVTEGGLPVAALRFGPSSRQLAPALEQLGRIIARMARG